MSLFEASTINCISRWLNYLFSIPLILFGLIGALLTILVFTHQPSFRRNPTIIYLISGSIMTSIHLPFVYLQSILVDGFGLGLYNTNQMACREHNYLLYVTTIIAISFPCWASFDQYASTCREAYFRNRWNSIRVVRLAILSTILFWTIVYLPMIFLSDIVNKTCVLKNVLYRKLNDYFLTPLVFTIGPLTLILIFTRRTIENLRSLNYSNRRNYLTGQIRRMIIPQLIVLCISGIPFGLQNIYIDLTENIPKDQQIKAMENFCIQIIRLFFHFNFVCTFYIYLYMSSEVRSIFKRLTMNLARNDIDILTTDSLTLQQIISDASSHL